MADIVLVDDDAELVQSLLRVLARFVSPRTICAAGNASSALELIKSERPLVAVVDLCLDERIGIESGFDLLRQIQARWPDMRVLVLTGHGSRSNGIRAMQLGASSFLEKPIDPEHLAILIRDAIAQGELRREYERLLRQGDSGLVSALSGISAATVKLREEIAFAAATSQPVLILGETGTGKGLCARLIHEHGVRRTRKFVHYQPNFGGGDIVRSELFGHVRGAFTGAAESRRGLAVEADGGTLFIDELDAVPQETQVSLLDLIQEQRIRPIGSDSYHQVNCRFIAATNRPLEAALSEGLIRKDLHHRIAHTMITIPPLRERPEDIPVLVNSVLEAVRIREGLNVFEIEPALTKELQKYNWPGNIRELHGAIEGGAFRANFRGRSVIDLGDVVLGGKPAGISRADAADSAKVFASNATERASFHDQVEVFKRDLVRKALQECEGNQLRAALLLGVDRGTIRRLG
jgi:DNA-binding NtrC family response regulator